MDTTKRGPTNAWDDVGSLGEGPTSIWGMLDAPNEKEHGCGCTDGRYCGECVDDSEDDKFFPARRATS